MKITGLRKDNLDGRIPEPFEYGKTADGHWMGMTPNGMLANLSAHKIIEHPDETITVTPSILVTGHAGQWHGYLTAGCWEEC